jgi:hypothetical protein
LTLDESGSGQTYFYIKTVGEGTTKLDPPCANEHSEICLKAYWDEIEYAGFEYTVNVAGGGKRIFPGRVEWDDVISRRAVGGEATGTPNGMIFFKAFDVDDPSADTAPLDDDSGPTGDDNRGSPKTGILSSTSVQADESGKAFTTFVVTMNPGDNFRLAASCTAEYLNGVTVDGVNLKDGDGDRLPTDEGKVTDMLTVWRRFHIEQDVMAPVTGNVVTGIVKKVAIHPGGTKLTLEQLQVNGVSIQSLNDKGRNGRFENGRILLLDGATVLGDHTVLKNGRTTVTVGSTDGPDSTAERKAFKLVDDDDYNNSSPLFPNGDEGETIVAPDEIYRHMREDDEVYFNPFAEAYIHPVYDEAGVEPTADRDNVPFALNVPDDSASIENRGKLGRDSGNHERDDYWVVYVQMAYQGHVKQDNDPAKGEGATLGVGFCATAHDATSTADVPQGCDVSLVFLETIQDNKRGEDMTLPHEVGHQFGLAHGPQGRCGWGIMSSGCSSDPSRFLPQHLNMLRWRMKSPGQS